MNIVELVPYAVMMALMSIVPLLSVVYLGSDGSRAGVVALLAAVAAGTGMGFALTA